MPGKRNRINYLDMQLSEQGMCINKNSTCAATRLAKCHMLSRKQVTHLNIPFPDDPFIHVQVAHAHTNSFMCN